jgi:hypothetical protein
MKIILVGVAFLLSSLVYADFENTSQGRGEFDRLPPEVVAHMAQFLGNSVNEFSRTSQDNFQITYDIRKKLRVEFLKRKLIDAQEERGLAIQGLRQMQEALQLQKYMTLRESACYLQERCASAWAYLTRRPSPIAEYSLWGIFQGWKKNNELVKLEMNVISLIEWQIVLLGQMIQCIETTLADGNDSLIPELYDIDMNVIELRELIVKMIRKCIEE